MNQYIPIILIAIVPYLIIFINLIYKSIKTYMKYKEIDNDNLVDLIFYSLLGGIYGYIVSLLI
jgi:hypothetical protein